MMKKLMSAMTVLLIFSGSAYSQWADTVRNAVEYSWTNGGWQELSVLALLISFFIVILAYMVSIIIGSNELRQWAKSELLQVAASAALVLGLIIFVGLLLESASIISTNLFSHALAPPPDLGMEPLNANQQASPFAVSLYYLDIQINCSKKYYRSIFWLNLFFEPLEKTLFPTGGMEEVSGWALSGISGMIHWIEHQLTFILIVNYFQRHLLLFIEDNMFTVVLPIGILLRILPYTRGAGGVLIAIAMGLFLIYPIMYGVLLGLIPPSSCSPQAPNSISPYKAIDPVFIFNVITHHTYGTSEILKFIDGVLLDIHLLFVSSLVFPVINLIITLTFVRATMQFLGADVAEMGQGILKLI